MTIHSFSCNPRIFFSLCIIFATHYIPSSYASELSQAEKIILKKMVHNPSILDEETIVFINSMANSNPSFKNQLQHDITRIKHQTAKNLHEQTELSSCAFLLAFTSLGWGTMAITTATGALPTGQKNEQCDDYCLTKRSNTTLSIIGGIQAFFSTAGYCWAGVKSLQNRNRSKDSLGKLTHLEELLNQDFLERNDITLQTTDEQ